MEKVRFISPGGFSKLLPLALMLQGCPPNFKNNDEKK
jgi:hypothetical protein